MRGFSMDLYIIVFSSSLWNKRRSGKAKTKKTAKIMSTTMLMLMRKTIMRRKKMKRKGKKRKTTVHRTCGSDDSHALVGEKIV
jgi:hypothetical protein